MDFVEAWKRTDSEFYRMTLQIEGDAIPCDVYPDRSASNAEYRSWRADDSGEYFGPEPIGLRGHLLIDPLPFGGYLSPGTETALEFSGLAMPILVVATDQGGGYERIERTRVEFGSFGKPIEIPSAEKPEKSWRDGPPML